MEFIFAFFHRVLSGTQSYLGYSKNYLTMWIVSVLYMLYPWFNSRPHWLFILFMLINIFVILMKASSFDRTALKHLDKIKDIHFWEILVTGGYFLWMVLAGYNIILLCCSVYPALILHKGLINLGSGLKFFVETTDDPTGKTYGIPILKVRVKRNNTKTRLIMAGISMLIALIVWIFNINIHLSLLPTS